jgi:putative peptide zinc metalloprotease protein
MAAAPTGSAAARLIPLREEIGIFPGPPALDGSPTWTLHDPARNRFYRLGWPEFEIISRWDSGTIAALIQRLDSETMLQIEREDIEALIRFLLNFDLLRVSGPQATANLVRKAEQQRESWGHWLLHNYLFTRIPLVRPDRFLSETYRYVRWVHSRQFALAVIATGLLGLYLIARQWDTFLHTFVDLFTVAGAVSFGITLMCLKVVHELGHAYTAKRFGCRVPNMGVALLVMVPVLYTDVNEAWKLTSRRQRLAIGMAGVTAELCCAAIAACLWGFLPDGPMRSAAFLVATTTWVTTVLLNLSPFMRYDGYYVLSDLLETPNLHTRAFALARWWLRESLFGFGDSVPEELPVNRRRLLIVFAFVTWVYRFSLFFGIALVVYHFAFKAIGIAMVAIEVGYFMVRPIGNEVLVWVRRRGELRWSRRTMITAGAVFLFVVLLIVPWRSGIEAPALLRSRQHVDAFVPDFGAQIRSVSARNGETVSKGTILLQLVSPDLDYKLANTRSEIETLKWQVNARGIDPELLARSQVSEREYQAALAQYRALMDEKARLQVIAPISGQVVDIADGLEPGVWLPAKARLLSVVDSRQATVEAFIDEADLTRVAPGDVATFHSRADDRISVALRVTEIARASTRVLREPYLASVHGGPIPVRPAKNNEFIPDRTIYRVTLMPVTPEAAPSRVTSGTVTLQGRAQSIASQLWRSLLAIVVREAGA